MRGVDQNAEQRPIWRSVALGGAGFAAVSLGGFGVWAFGGKWFYQHTGEGGLYLASTVVFLALSGLLLHPLVDGPRRVRKFYRVFIPAFLGYAFAWSICWFIGRFGKGEWFGSLAGAAVFAWIAGHMLGSTRAIGKVTLALFLTHSAGYFLGGKLYAAGAHPPAFVSFLSKEQIGLAARLLWGLCYGLGFGAGIGYAFAVFQRDRSNTVA